MPNTFSDDSSELTELHSGLFEGLAAADFGVGDETPESSASPSSPSTPTLALGKRKRKVTAKKLWAFARVPHPHEPVRTKHGHRIFYCVKCKDYSAASTTNARLHMKTKHGVDVVEDENKVKKQARSSLESLLQRQCIQAKLREKQILEQAFEESINAEAFHEALTRLITVRNLPDNCIEWPELRSLLSLCNYTIDSLLCTSHITVPVYIKNTFLQHQEILIQRLHAGLSKIHLTTDMWTANITHQPY